MRGHQQKDTVLGLRLGGSTIRQTQRLAELVTPLGNGLIKYLSVRYFGKNLSLYVLLEKLDQLLPQLRVIFEVLRGGKKDVKCLRMMTYHLFCVLLRRYHFRFLV